MGLGTAIAIGRPRGMTSRPTNKSDGRWWGTVVRVQVTASSREREKEPRGNRFHWHNTAQSQPSGRPGQPKAVGVDLVGLALRCCCCCCYQLLALRVYFVAERHGPAAAATFPLLLLSL